VYGCADNFLTVDRTEVLNSRGCRDVMYSWYRAGFVQNIIMAIIGLLIGAFEFYLYSLNRREYYKLLDELDDMRKPMINATMSMSTINSKGSGGAGSGAGMPVITRTPAPNSARVISFGPTPQQFAQRALNNSNQQTPSMASSVGLPTINADNNYEGDDVNTSNFANPLQNVQNASARIGYNRPRGLIGAGNNNNSSDRFLINEGENDQ
jgi:hypothetical protein